MNADGLADVVVNHNVGGRSLVNDGRQWKDLDGFSNFAAADSEDRTNGHWVPTAEPVHLLAWAAWNNDGPPRPYLNAFVDLDGDGVVDLLTIEKLRAIKRLMDVGMRPGKIILFSQPELDALADSRIAPRLLVMRRGQIVARTTPSETVLCPKGWKKEVISFDPKGL